MKDALINTSRKLAITSFSLGTILFLSEKLVFNNGELYVLGFVYLLIAIAINLIFAIALLGDIFIKPEIRMYLIKTLEILLLKKIEI